MRQYKFTLVYGFAIFAMFFGSGNLVFPIQIGYNSGSNWLWGFLGIFITGILLPFLGLFVIKIHKGNYHSFFNEAGKLAGMIIPLFALSLLGPFAVVPRCIIVAYGSIAYIFPEVSLFSFSIIFCIIMFMLCLKDQIMINIIGKWMCPVLMIVLSALILIGINKAQIPISSSNSAFIDAFLTGYQLMDLFAAFFFSSLIFTQIQSKFSKSTTHRDILLIAIKPSILGALLLGVIYFGFVYLGAHYNAILTNIAPEFMLPAIANHLMGKNAAFLIGVATLLSCMTTAIALTNIYSRYICNCLNLKENKFWIILIITISATFAVSLLNFKGIAKFLAPILDILYPGMIALTILSIFFREQKKIKFYAFYGISAVMLIMNLVSYL